MSMPSTRRFLRWELWSVALWAAFGLINGTQTVVGMHAEGMQHAWGKLFAVHALSWAIWSVISPFVVVLGRRYPPRRYWPIHVGFYLAIGVANAGLSLFLEGMIKPLGPSHQINGVPSILGFFYSRLHLDVLAYLGLLGISRMIDSQESLHETEEQLSKARLDALRRQLQPHFLFNALNGISGLIRNGDNKAAVNMVAGLSDLLRRVVDERGDATSTLAEELSFVQKYLELQKMRFGDRLQVRVNVPVALQSISVPALILQPLVENALEHGIGKLVQGGTVSITASRAGKLLLIRIVNDGPELKQFHEGVGITNTRARLKNLLGVDADVQLRGLSIKQVETTVKAPLRD